MTHSRHLRASTAAIWAILLAAAGPAHSATGPAWTKPVQIDGTQALHGISCPSQKLCVATDGAGNVLHSSNPMGGSRTWKSAHVDFSNSINAVSCPSAAFCAAADDFGNVLTSTNPGGGAAAWTSAAVDAGHFLYGISCPSNSLCVAVDASGRIVASNDPAGGPSAWTTPAQVESSGRWLLSVDCPSAVLCVAGDTGGNAVVSDNPTGGVGAWPITSTVFDSDYIYSVSCVSAQLCVMGDSKGSVLATGEVVVDPGGSLWAIESIDPGRALRGMSCLPGPICVAVDSDGNALASTDPLGGDPGWRKRGIDAGHGLQDVSCNGYLCAAVDDGGAVVVGARVKRPGTTITNAFVSSRRHLADFSFRARGVASGLQCRLRASGARLGTFAACTSPRIYRHLAAGRYTFEVRAVNALGADRTPAKRKFRI